MNKRLIIRPSFCIGICISLFVLPLWWVLAWLTAALIHEAGHLLALSLMRVRIIRFEIGIQGGCIETGHVSELAELICALAGPVAGLCCLLLFDIFPLMSVCALVQSIYNLLPYSEYDGGRGLKILVGRMFGAKTGERICIYTSMATSVLLVIAGLLFWLVFRLGLAGFLVPVFPVIKRLMIKIPCKQRKQIVQ